MVNALCMLLVSVQSWNMTLAGDVMLYRISAKTNPLARIANITKASDVFIANLEIPLTTSSTATTRKTPEQVKLKQQFILKADPAHMKHLVAAGIDAVSLGNNHTMDYGLKGLLEETALLRRHGIAFAGAGLDQDRASEPCIVQSGNSPKIGMVSFLTFLGAKHRWINTPATPSSAGVAVPPFESAINKKAKTKIKEIVSRAKSGSDFVVIALHGGIERKTMPTSYQVALARAFVDAGADLVVGHHPHVLQGAELYRGRPILYSTGNLVNSLPGTTALFHLRFEGKRLVKVSMTPCAISKGAVAPMKAKQARVALKTLDDLSRKVQRKYPHKWAKPLLSSYRA